MSGSAPELIVVGPDPRDPGGITAALDALRQGGLEDALDLTPVSLAPWDARIAGKALATARGLWRLRRQLDSTRPQVVHINSSIGASFYRKAVAARIARRAGVPYIFHIHSGAFESWIRAGRWRLALARKVLSEAAAVIVLAEIWRAGVIELGAQRTSVIPNSLPAKRLAELDRVRQRRRPGSQISLLYYGRWAAVKGPDLLADALRQIEGAADVEVRLFGNGDREWLEHAFDGVAAKVRIGGWLEGEAKLEELEATTALLVPSRKEGFGQTLLDAMAAGVPVIASDAGAIPEVLAGYDCQATFAAGDASGLGAILGDVLGGRWPPAAKATTEFPARFETEAVVAELVELARQAATSP